MKRSEQELLRIAHLVCAGFLSLLGAASAFGQAPQQPGLPPLPHPDIAPPPEVVESSTDWRTPGIIALTIVVAVAGGILLINKRPASHKPSGPPLDLAQQRLRALLKECAALPPAETGHRVSVIIRDYQEAKYALPAPYRTREEIYDAPSATVADTQHERFAPLALSCDELAFAPVPATHADAEALVKSAVEALRQEAYQSSELRAAPQDEHSFPA